MGVKRIALIGGIGLLGWIGLGVSGALNSPPLHSPAPSPATTGATGKVYSIDLLRRAAQMTQGMSTTNASGPMFNGQIVDEQLRLAERDPEFVLELNQYEADLNRSLGRSAPSR